MRSSLPHQPLLFNNQRVVFNSSTHCIVQYYLHTFELILLKRNLKRLFFTIIPPPPGNFLTCTICEAVMTAIDQSIVDPTNEQVAFMIIIIFWSYHIIYYIVDPTNEQVEFMIIIIFGYIILYIILLTQPTSRWHLWS